MVVLAILGAAVVYYREVGEEEAEDGRDRLL